MSAVMSRQYRTPGVITGHDAIDLPPIPCDLCVEEVAVARKAVESIAKDRAVEHLIATAKEVLALMPITENRALHARLRSDIAALSRFGLGGGA